MKLSLGDLSDVGTPGPIPNPEVKHVSADGTWRATSRESRSLPRGFSLSIGHPFWVAFYFNCYRAAGGSACRDNYVLIVGLVFYYIVFAEIMKGSG